METTHVNIYNKSAPLPYTHPSSKHITYALSQNQIYKPVLWPEIVCTMEGRSCSGLGLEWKASLLFVYYALNLSTIPSSFFKVVCESFR